MRRGSETLIAQRRGQSANCLAENEMRRRCGISRWGLPPTTAFRYLVTRAPSKVVPPAAPGRRHEHDYRIAGGLHVFSALALLQSGANHRTRSPGLRRANALTPVMVC